MALVKDPTMIIRCRSKYLKLLIPVLLLLGIVLTYRLYHNSESLSGNSRSDHHDVVSMKELLSVSISLARSAGAQVKRIREESAINAQVKGKTKEGADELFTMADIESNRILLCGFQIAYPQLKVRSEENLTVQSFHLLTINKELPEVSFINDELISLADITVWVDPLDATQEYTENLKQYVTTMVCIAVNGVATIGVIEKPFQNETVWAYVGHGTSPSLVTVRRQNGAVNRKVIISRSHSGQVETFIKQSLGDSTEVIRAGGAGYKVLQVIEGVVDAYLHTSVIKKWDVCAGNALLSAVKGQMTTLEGHHITYHYTDSEKIDSGLVATIFNYQELSKSLILNYSAFKSQH